MKKQHLLLLFLLLSSAVYGSDTTLAKLHIRVSECRVPQTYLYARNDTLCLYRDTAASPFMRLSYSYPMERNCVADSLLPGVYYTTYHNIFDQLIRKEVLVPAGGSTITLCLDSLDAYPYHTLDRLTDQDTLVILEYSIGCFHQTGQKMVISKSGDQFTARLYRLKGWYDERDNMLVAHDTKGKLLLKKRMAASVAKAAFGRFENELRIAEGGGCTTMNSICIRSPYGHYTRHHANCSWNGFYYLRLSLFGK